MLEMAHEKILKKGAGDNKTPLSDDELFGVHGGADLNVTEMVLNTAQDQVKAGVLGLGKKAEEIPGMVTDLIQQSLTAENTAPAPKRHIANK